MMPGHDGVVPSLHSKFSRTVKNHSRECDNGMVSSARRSGVSLRWLAARAQCKRLVSTERHCDALQH